MSATRLLLLGVLLDGPMHGYDVRRELETWGAEGWAGIAYGSIYFGLKKMAQEGLLEVTETGPGRGRSARTVYGITEKGREEFDRLLRDQWWTIKPVHDPFTVALTFMDRLERDELLAALRFRRGQAQAAVEMLEYLPDVKLKAGVSGHVVETMRLGEMQCRAILAWVDETIEKIERGELP